MEARTSWIVWERCAPLRKIGRRYRIGAHLTVSRRALGAIRIVHRHSV